MGEPTAGTAADPAADVGLVNDGLQHGALRAPPPGGAGHGAGDSLRCVAPGRRHAEGVRRQCVDVRRRLRRAPGRPGAGGCCGVAVTLFQRLYWGILVWFCVSAVAWLLGAVAHDAARMLLWSLAIVIEYGSARLGWWVPWQKPERILAWEAAAGHLADRYQQLVLIALGETILAVGIAYTEASGSRRFPQTFGLVIAFITAVLLWRIYFYRAGEVFGSAVKSAANPARLGRVAGSAHLLMILGVAAAAIGNELVQKHPTGHTFKSWLALMLGGPALFVAGRTLLEWVVFSRVSRPRLLGIAALLLLAVPLAFAPPLVVVTVVAVVLLAIAVADARRAAGKPAEAPTPPG
nr:low temperature requirement protein A [Micromonospora aurantiaca]